MKALLGSIVLTLLLIVGSAPGQDLKKEDVPKLLKDAKSGTPKVRVTAIEGLGELGAINASYVKEAVPTIVEIAKNERDVNVRKAAVRALGKVPADPKETVPILMDSLKDKNNDIKTAAMESLGQLGPEAKSALPALRAIQKDKEMKQLSRSATMAIKRISAKQ